MERKSLISLGSWWFVDGFWIVFLVVWLSRSPGPAQVCKCSNAIFVESFLFAEGQLVRDASDWCRSRIYIDLD